MYQIESRIDIPTAYTQFQTSEKGLSEEEAQRRLVQYGQNLHPAKKRPSLMNLFIMHLKNWFNAMLLLSAFLSYLVGVLSNDPESNKAGTALVIVLFVNVVFSMFQEYRATRVIQILKGLIPKETKVIRSGEVEQIDVKRVVPGDLVLLEEGDTIPADLRLIHVIDASVNNSALTGESLPQRRTTEMELVGEIKNPADLPNVVFAGTILVTGIARGIVIKTGMDTLLGHIITISRQVQEPPSALQLEIDRSAKITLIAATGIALVFFSIALSFVGITFWKSIIFGIGVMMCLVPQGLQVTLSLSMAVIASRMAKNDVVVKRLSSIETLGAMSVLCVDKTGTMTSGEMMVEKVWTRDASFQVTGDGYNPTGLIKNLPVKQDNMHGRQIIKTAAINKLLEVAACCNNARLLAPNDKLDRWRIIGDPTDGAFLVLAEKGHHSIQQASQTPRRVDLIPFESKRRMMTSIHEAGDGRFIAYAKGAGDEILEKCSTILMHDSILPLTSDLKREIISQMESYASQGYRVIAMAYRIISQDLHESIRMIAEITEIASRVEGDLTFVGLAALADPPRPRVKEAVLEALQAGIKVIMLTGDSELTAEAIARRIGIVSSPNPTIISGKQLENMDNSTLTQYLTRDELVFARILPEQKLRIAETLRDMGEIVCMTGDGINDVPALIEANAGVAMGVGGTDAAREAADLVLLDNNFASIIEAVKLGRAGFRNIRRFVGYVYTHNFAELGVFIAYILLGLPLPLSVVQILAIDLCMDVLPSLALIMEPPQPDIMNQPPQKSNRLLDARVLLRAAFIGTIISIVVLVVAFDIWFKSGWMLGQGNIQDPVAYARGTTAVMAGIMAGQVGNLFCIRTTLESASKLSPLRNKWLFVGIASQFGIMLLIMYVPLLQGLFGTNTLSVIELLSIYALAPVVFIVDEIRKVVKRWCSSHQERSITRE